MALIVDADIVDIPSLLLYENGLLETADKERVDIAAKVQLATEEVRTRIGSELRRYQNGSVSTGGYTLQHVLVTEPLEQWLRCHTLHLFYLECFGNQLNERYKSKQADYRRRVSEASELYLSRGVAVVSQPLPRPLAPDALSSAGSIPEGTYYVAITWQGYGQRESAPSKTTTFHSNGSQGLQIQAENGPPTAVGWNVYVGASAETMARQNVMPLAIGLNWVLVNAPGTNGQQWQVDHEPDFYLQPQNLFLRG